MATVTIKFQNSLNWYIWFTSTSYQCWLNPLKTHAIFIILAVLVIKHVQRVLPKLHAERASLTYRDIWHTTKNKRSSVLNLPKQRQACPSLFFQFNMRISVIYGTLSVSCKRVVSVLSPLESNSCGGSQIVKQNLKLKVDWSVSIRLYGYCLVYLTMTYIHRFSRNICLGKYTQIHRSVVCNNHYFCKDEIRMDFP